MERGHEFTIELLGHGTYVVKLLERVEIEQSAGVTLGRWPDFDLQAKSDDVGRRLPGPDGRPRAADRRPARLAGDTSPSLRTCENTARGWPTRMPAPVSSRICRRSPSAGTSLTPSNTWSGFGRTD
jgi:hypothetical protein